MKKVDLKSGEVISKEAAFHSKTEVNLESTNSNELFSKLKETVWESLAKANNVYMGADFDPAEESKFISYLDVNGLYCRRCRNHFQRLYLKG